MSPRTLFRPPVPTANGDRRMTPAEHAQHRQDRDDWWNAATIAQMGRLAADWLEGRRYFLPGYAAAGPATETRDLIAHLAAYNRAGFLTISSQPGHEPRPGYDGAHWAQRAYVTGYATPDVAYSLHAALRHRFSLTERHADRLTFWNQTCPPRRRRRGLAPDYIDATIREDPDRPGRWDVMNAQGATMRRIDLKRYYRGEINPAGIRALADARKITVIDTEYRETDTLWAALNEWARRRIEPTT